MQSTFGLSGPPPRWWGGRPRAVTPIDLTFRTRSKLAVSRLLGWLCVLPLGLLIVAIIRYHAKLKIRNHAELRRQFLEICRDQRPLVICANHLTIMDSVVLHWALASMPRYFWNYRLFSWNVPAVENATKYLSWRIITALSKCLAIDRAGNAEHHDDMLQQISFLVSRGELVTIFPEGTRSRTGRVEVETGTYGIGKIVRSIPGCRVLCIYMRGDGQFAYSTFPRLNETFTIKLKTIEPISSHRGLRAVRDCAQQVMLTIGQMEQEYFLAHPEFSPAFATAVGA
ncbi:MAG: 1-acyl-sn-glycerol-3-phosphate acyltransferase [Oligoflexia bacterium]|nr:1-acyl-sn-glycerol-3-phosphate acyltransferase [Oligoflexia bacterium]